jgi:glutamate-1-semialdehyde 2,1-aminomutase
MVKTTKSYKQYLKAKKVIPLASQTFSRSYLFFDPKKQPLFNDKGIGQYIFDLDNNKYLDLINGLGSVSIGYSIKEINKKIIHQLKKGITFSLSSNLETVLAEELKKIIPSCEMVKFGKNGTDVNSAAIRLARYTTKREDIAVCGYHGWQDWYIISTTMDGGIPKKLKNYTDNFKFNDIDSLKRLFKKKTYAAVIIEPVSVDEPNNNFLQKVRDLCNQNGTILIFDEICSGFRVNIGGAQKLYNVKPDLSTFGKGIANGMPLSVLVGKKSIMKNLNKIFYSGTFYGETLSIISAISTIRFIKRNNSIKKNIIKGKELKKKLDNLIKKFELQNFLEISGHPSWLFVKTINKNLNINENIKDYIKQELINNKILFIGSFNINHSTSNKDLEKVIKIFIKIFSKIKDNINQLNKLIVIDKPKVKFSVRNK